MVLAYFLALDLLNVFLDLSLRIPLLLELLHNNRHLISQIVFKRLWKSQSCRLIAGRRASRLASLRGLWNRVPFALDVLSSRHDQLVEVLAGLKHGRVNHAFLLRSEVVFKIVIALPDQSVDARLRVEISVDCMLFIVQIVPDRVALHQL